MKVKRYMKGLIFAASAFLGMAATSCEDEPDKYEIADGVPSIRYVRMTSPEVADSLITGAYLSNTICLVGDNLRSIYELYFNDQKAVLNTSVMTDNTVIVDVPSTIPTEVTNKIYMVTKGGQTVDYDFNVLVPEPQITSMTCEYAAPGTEVTLGGNYFINDESVPLSITIGETPVTEISEITQSSVSFTIPQDVATEPSYIYVTSIYGTGQSTFRYREDTGILFDFDNDGDDALYYKAGTHPAEIGTIEKVQGIDGNYLVLDGSLNNSYDWKDSDFSFQYWADWTNEVGEETPALNDASVSPYLSEIERAEDLENLQLKFEVNVPDVWSAAAMQIALTPSEGIRNTEVGDKGLFDSSVNPNQTSYPRALWMPWRDLEDGYRTEGWVTVTIPLSEFRYTSTGNSVSPLSATDLSDLSIFVYGGGVEGTKCSPTICVDNIRVVPIY